MRKVGYSLLIVAGLALAAGSAVAQTKVGSTLGTFLRIEPGARGAALGNAGSALPGDIEAIYYNTGSLGQLEHSAVLYSHADWFAGISHDYIGVAVPVRGFGNLYTSVTALNSGEIMVRTVDQPEGTGVNYTVSNVALGLGYGRKITERFSAGLQANYVTERIWNTSQKTMTFNLGTLYRLNGAGAMLGFSLLNVGTQARFTGRDLNITYDADSGTYGDNGSLPGQQSTDSFPLPGLFRLGISWPVAFGDRNRLLFLAEGLHPNDNSESLNLGTECQLGDLLALRLGYQTLGQEDSQLGVTFGFGVKGRLGSNAYRFDYAWAGHDYLDDTHRLTMVVEF
jgi:hypothetical protein